MGFGGVEDNSEDFGLSTSHGGVITEWGRLCKGQVLGVMSGTRFSSCLKCLKLVIKMDMSCRQLDNKSNKLGSNIMEERPEMSHREAFGSLCKKQHNFFKPQFPYH